MPPACTTPAWDCGGPERIEAPAPKPKAEAKGVVQTDTTLKETEGGTSVASVALRHLAQPTVLRPSCRTLQTRKSLYLRSPTPELSGAAGKPRHGAKT